MNIAVEVSPQDQLKKILVATKDFKAGDVIYQVRFLDTLQGSHLIYT